MWIVLRKKYLEWKTKVRLENLETSKDDKDFKTFIDAAGQDNCIYDSIIY